MIEKVYGEFYLRCDVCQILSYESFDTFQDAADGQKNLGWDISLQCSGEFEDVCPECQEG